ncbi:hypothetical protein D3C74_50750 [compost metagenome]
MSTDEKETQPISYIHIDEYLLTRPDLRREVKAGFRVFMKGRSYQLSREDFDKEVQNYFKQG